MDTQHHLQDASSTGAHERARLAQSSAFHRDGPYTQDHMDHAPLMGADENAQLAQDTQPATQTTFHQDGSQTPSSHDQDDTTTATANITSDLPGNKFQECFGEVDRNCNPQPCFSTSSRSTKDYRQKHVYSLCSLYAVLPTMRATTAVNLRVL